MLVSFVLFEQQHKDEGTIDSGKRRLLRGIHYNKPIRIGPAVADLKTRNRLAQLRSILKLLTDRHQLGRSQGRLILMNTPLVSTLSTRFLFTLQLHLVLFMSLFKPAGAHWRKQLDRGLSDGAVLRIPQKAGEKSNHQPYC